MRLQRQALSGEEADEAPSRDQVLRGDGSKSLDRSTAAENGRQCKKCNANQVQGRVLEGMLGFAERRGTHWVGYVEATRCLGVVCCGRFVWEAVCMGEEEGDFERGGGTPVLVFYYGRLIE